MADAQASGACGRKIVWVQVPSPALFFCIIIKQSRESGWSIGNAGVAELADAQASGACGRKIVWVQVPSPALFFCLGEVKMPRNFDRGH